MQWRAWLATLILAVPASASAGEVIARIPVERPAVVIVEREPDGTIRLIIEVLPGSKPLPKPNPNPNPKPNPRPAPPGTPLEIAAANYAIVMPGAYRGLAVLVEQGHITSTRQIADALKAGRDAAVNEFGAALNAEIIKLTAPDGVTIADSAAFAALLRRLADVMEDAARGAR